MGDSKAPLDTDSAGKGSITGSPIGNTESQNATFSDETAQVIDGAAERALCRKFDFRLLPVLAVMVSSSILFASTCIK
jgi:hypothetical protein